MPTACNGRVVAAFALVAAVAATPVAGRVIEVGPSREIGTLEAAARVARSGDVVEVDAGRYVDDVAVFDQDELVVRAVGGRAQIVSQRRTAQDKAVFVVRGRDITVEGFEFSGARVPDHNGAGIRHERGRLTVRDCLFEDNEMGILTSNDEELELIVERSEFRANAVAAEFQPGDPGHQIYAGTIGRFTLRESYIHQGAFGHLVKSRARENVIEYNRLTDEPGGRSSYELEFPVGGLAFVVGNVIEQSSTTHNETIVSYGAEGYRWPVNELYVVHNTLVDDLPQGGRVLWLRPGAARVDLVDNLVIGNRLQATGVPGRFAGNYTATPHEAADPAHGDYRLRAGARAVGSAVEAGSARGRTLRAVREYVHPRASRAIAASRNPGALQQTAR